MATAKLEHILSGEVEIPADVQRYTVKDGEWLMCDGIALDGIVNDLHRLIYTEDSALGRAFRGSWPASCAWVVEWEDETFN